MNILHCGKSQKVPKNIDKDIVCKVCNQVLIKV